MPEAKPRKVEDMSTEYRFNYRDAKLNRFASGMKDEPLVVLIEPDIAKIFKTPEQVNKTLRALMAVVLKEKVK